MSSFRKAAPRRTHKERAQPSARSKYGLLEKHKDYVLRAKDYHRKQESIQKLQEKAAFKNPDEFYHRMINAKTVDGVHRPESQGNQYTQEELLLMKTQDIRYVLNKAQSEQRKVERLQSVLHFIEEQPSNQHVHFAEDRDEAIQLKDSLSQIDADAPSSSKNMKRHAATGYKELKERKQRAEKLRRMVSEMSLQKQLMGKGKKRKLRSEELSESTDRPVYQWRKERKKIAVRLGSAPE